MKAESLPFWEQAVPDLYPSSKGYEGTCPACGSDGFVLRVYGSDQCEPNCSRCKASANEIEAAARRAMGFEAKPPLPEPPPERPRKTARAPNGAEPPPPEAIEGHRAPDLLALELPPARFAIPDYVCEGLNLLAGGPKKGKSWLALAWAVSVATGGMALGKVPVEAGTVLYLALEDGPRRLQSRLRLILGEAEAPRNLWLYHRWPAIDAGGIPAVEEWLRQHKRTRLVIIDTLARFRGTRANNSDVYQQDYDTGARLKRLADDHQVALLVLHHLSKRQSEDPFDQVSGTIGVTGSADATLLLHRQRGRDDATLFVTGRDVEEREMAISWSRECCTWTLEGTAEEFKRSEERGAILSLLRSKGPMAPREISKALGWNASTTRVLLMKMIETGELRGGGGMYWTPSLE